MQLPFVELVVTFLATLVWPQGHAHAGHEHNTVKVGRLTQFDQLVTMYLPEMHVNGDIHIGHIVQMVKQLRKQFKGTEEEKRFADYYVKVFEMIHQAKTMAVINKERKRLEDIMEEGGEVGLEAEHQWNIVNGFSELAADHLMEMLDVGTFEKVELHEDQPGTKKPSKKKATKQKKEEL